MDVYVRTQIKKSQKKGQSVIFIQKMVFCPCTPGQARQSVHGGQDDGTLLPPRTRVTPLAKTMGEDGNTRLALLTQMLMRELESDDESMTKEHVMLWYRELQEHVRNLKEENKELPTEVIEMKESAARTMSDMLGHAQVVHYMTDLRTHHRINALVMDKLFPVKNFVVSQKELDDLSGDSSIGMLATMTKSKI
jgi:hypothetical protein